MNLSNTCMQAIGQDCQVLQRNHLIIAPRNTHTSPSPLSSTSTSTSRRLSLPTMNKSNTDDDKGGEIGTDVSPLSSFRNKGRRNSESQAASKQSTSTSTVNFSADPDSFKFEDVSLTWDYVDVQVTNLIRKF